LGLAWSVSRRWWQTRGCGEGPGDQFGDQFSNHHFLTILRPWLCLREGSVNVDGVGEVGAVSVDACGKRVLTAWCGVPFPITAALGIQWTAHLLIDKGVKLNPEDQNTR
jgi:hypothetical protein